MRTLLSIEPDHPTQYQDHKRLLWNFPFLISLLTILGPAAHLMGAVSQVWFFAPIVFIYAGVVLIDWMVGEDQSNPPDAEVPHLEADHYYRWILYFTMPFMWACVLFNLVFLATQDLPWYSWLALVLTNGLTLGGLGLTISHELGHKKTWLARKMALFQASLVGYGHFNIEHNRGHHRDVATPEDCASSKMGENIYRFMCRELPGAFLRGWRLESERLARQGHSTWHHSNEIIQGWLMMLAAYTLLVVALGVQIIPAIGLMMFWGAFQLTSANYIEHYGLLRKKLANGQYERCMPHHSWNSNLIASNLFSYHLQRHSDHHANPARSYQSLRNFDNLPTLPTGYFGMFFIAYFPPLWFALMNKRVVAATGHQTDRINFLPTKRNQLIQQFDLK